MKNQNRVRLYQLAAMTEFKYYGKLYRTITNLKYTVMNKHRAAHKREVINLATNKPERLGYFSNVTIV